MCVFFVYPKEFCLVVDAWKKMCTANENMQQSETNWHDKMKLENLKGKNRTLHLSLSVSLSLSICSGRIFVASTEDLMLLCTAVGNWRIFFCVVFVLLITQASYFNIENEKPLDSGEFHGTTTTTTSNKRSSFSDHIIVFVDCGNISC